MEKSVRTGLIYVTLIVAFIAALVLSSDTARAEKLATPASLSVDHE